MGIFRVFKQFSRERKTGDKQRVERIGERADSCLTPMLTLKGGEINLF